MSPVSYTFVRDERLKNQTMIGQLFKGGHSYLAWPIRVVWRHYPAHYTRLPNARIQVAISAPKKQFKTAVARNRIKRLVREAWRLHKHELYHRLPPDSPPVALMLMYIAKEEVSFQEIETGVRKLIRKWPGDDQGKK